MTAPVLTRVWQHYGLRTSKADGTAYEGFQWPETGMVECPDWNPEPVCGGGLHALLGGEGGALYLSWKNDARWQLVGFDEYVEIDGNKVKFPRCEVATGTREQVTQAVRRLCASAPHGLIEAGGDDATLTGGCFATLTGGDDATLTGGDHATLTGGDHAKLTGGDHAKLTGGCFATLTGGDDATLTGGYGSKLTGGDDATLTGGDYATLTGGNYATLIGGDGSTLIGGDRATLSIKWWDGRRYRIAIAYVGENGIEPGVAYRLDARGKFVEAGR